MITRYSTCHFAEVMFEDKLEGNPIQQCSFCGGDCDLIPIPFTVNHDVKLTLRRWKDGDCSLDGMFNRLNTEYRRAWNEVFEAGQRQLQKGGEPDYKFDIATLSWNKRNSSPKAPKGTADGGINNG